jgi:hypothetical protein
VSTALSLPEAVLPEWAQIERIGVLAAEIKDHEVEAQQHAGTAIEHKIAIGERLIEAKGLLRHGEFLTWARAEFGWTASHLQKHTRLARNASRVTHLPDGASLRMALAAIRPASHPPAGASGAALETLVYAFTTCTLSLRCACGQELTGPVALTERGNGELVCTCGRRYVVGCDVRHG